MMIFKGFCIGFVCLILGGVIGYQASWYEVRGQATHWGEGYEVGKKSK
jgi:hypothetical protein